MNQMHRADAPWPVPHERSKELYERAQRVIPGGVMGQGRFAKPHPLYMTKAEGARMWDVDGNEYIDFHCAFGAVVLGHNDPRLRKVIDQTLDQHGVAFSAAHPLESELAERIVKHIPSAERVVFCCTGSEATYHAIRRSRAHTGRNKILKFEGAYHGWHDYVQWSVHFDPAEAGNADAPKPVQESAGMIRGAEDGLLTCGYNDIKTLGDIFAKHGADIAAVIVEPVYHNAGVVMPVPGFLAEIRALCDSNKSVLIFDEVITGFRLGLGGAQVQCGIIPDLTTMGKAIANGMPISAIAGKAEIMNGFAPLGKTFFSGTFYGHVLNVAVANGCMQVLENEPPYEYLDRLGNRLKAGIDAAIDEIGIPATVRQHGSVWGLYFTRRDLIGYRDMASFAQTKEHPIHSSYQRWMLENGIYIHPHFIVRGYLNAAHTEADIDRLVDATRRYFVAHKENLTEL
ncbi:aspartate aminotransferase family protein [Phyllobacterium sp. P30BS-XVII]|uniref:aspartate aminotransferase family protein n=1 Tax=Phyllobacterium sp. P30BS-XVII TaxID=2587046 RepID=UPI000DDFA22D|nr:aspartate aminotransferase family protein [Phyllobacterium sp. P30BS-XVII]MBA8903162.1 glutamate-1-semialdehyde 2,1-aminomutase [Phyllobacterium sp. P30BS-XVII]